MGVAEVKKIIFPELFGTGKELDMVDFSIGGNTYHVDSQGFLVDRSQWDENFVRGMAPKLKIEKSLSKKHWEVLYFIRKSYPIENYRA